MLVRLTWLTVTAMLGTACVGRAQVASAAAQNADSDEVEVQLKNLGPAPDLTNTIWLNADEPLRLSDLRGKVVLVDFWTFG